MTHIFTEEEAAKLNLDQVIQAYALAFNDADLRDNRLLLHDVLCRLLTKRFGKLIVSSEWHEGVNAEGAIIFNPIGDYEGSTMRLSEDFLEAEIRRAIREELKP